MVYLKSAGLQQADLVMLGQISEAWDLLSKLHHLPDSGGEAVGELLPHLVARLLWVHVRRSVHRTELRNGQRNTTCSLAEANIQVFIMLEYQGKKSLSNTKFSFYQIPLFSPRRQLIF